MITPGCCQVMARYNRWMNERLYALVADIPDDERKRELSRAVAAMHLFNHGTHHRGQLTTLLAQMGRDPDPTDLPWLPGVVRIVDAS